MLTILKKISNPIRHILVLCFVTWISVQVHNIHAILVLISLFLVAAVAIYDVRNHKWRTAITYTVFALYGVWSLIESILVYNLGAAHLMPLEQKQEILSILYSTNSQLIALTFLIAAFLAAYIDRAIQID